MPHPARARLVLAALALLAAALPGCGTKEQRLVPRSQTWAELRVVRRGITVTPPGEAERAPYPRERLVDGEAIAVREGGLGWLRRDGGATLLVRGPARLVLHADALEIAEGRVFIDTPEAGTTRLTTPGGPIHLAHVRASIDAHEKEGSTEAYVLAGEVRASATHAAAGDRLRLVKGEATTSPALSWEDWTGGLGTTDRSAEPAPYGVGTVGARGAGEQGTPRFPLAIQRLEARVTVDHDFAVTEVDETFFNPSAEVVEGLYRFRTPEGATLHRFGVDREGVIVWGRVKEKQAAAKQYQANVYQGSKEDPALLEWDAPGVYRARLYPIGPGESRRVVVRYAEWLGRTGKRGERRLYVYPMAAEGAEGTLPVIEELSVRFDLTKAAAEEVRVGMAGVREGHTVTVREHDLVPRADLALELFDQGAGGPAGYRAPHALARDTLPPKEREEAERRARNEADYVLVRLRPGDIPAPEGGLDLAIVVDTSAATDPASLAVARAATAALLAHTGKDDRVAVWTGDTGLRPLLPDRKGFAPVDDLARRRILAALAGVERGGATDLGGMLGDAATSLDPSRRSAIVYIGDAVPTVGETSLADLQTRLSKLPRPVRIFGLGVGDKADLGILEGLARGALAQRIGDGNGAARAALRVLEQAERPALLGASIDLGASVERIFPRDLGALVADESLLVVGRASGKESPTSVTITGPSGAPKTSPLLVSPIDDRGDLSQRWAEGRLAQLLDEGAGRAAMVDLGMRHGIMTPYTSFYVPTKNEMSTEERADLEKKKLEGKDTRWKHRATDDDVPARRAEHERTEVERARRQLSAQQAKMESLTDQLSSARDESTRVELQKQLEAESAKVGSYKAKAGAKPSMCQPGDPLCSGLDGDTGGTPQKGSGNRYGVRGPADNADPHIARQAALRESAEFGMIGLLNAGAGGDPNAPTAPWGRDDSLGNDPLSARGNTWGSEIGDADGQGGLGLAGVGEGGGGRGEGIGLGSIGTIGHGAGTGTGQGFGSGHGRLGGAHRSAPPSVRMGATQVNGRLPPEVIQRIVRQNFGRFRLCYENGLRNNPNLQGRVSVRYVIDRTGSVTNVANGGSDMPDGGVVSCVMRAFHGLSFPQPEGGVVTVTYPIMFSPGGGDPPKDKDKDEIAEAKAKKGAVAKPAGVTVRIDELPRFARLCGDAASVPFEDRVALWRERLGRYAWNPDAVALTYQKALSACELPTWRERARLLSMMLDAVPKVNDRVAVWRALVDDVWAATVIYQGILSRVRTPDEARALHAALGLKAMDPGQLAKTMKLFKTPAERAAKLRELWKAWPDDFALAMRLLDMLEDAGDDAGARALGRVLRARPDADAALRTAVGELYLRLSAKPAEPAQKAADEAEARRAFGEIVEFAPDDPVARRRLGDLLRAHGWYADATRQYETLSHLTPDDAGVWLLVAAAAEGLGKLEAAVKWTERAGTAGSPSDARSPAATAKAFAATYLAWGHLEATGAGRADEAKSIATRLLRVISTERSRAFKGTRVALTWAHPEFHPTLWTNALGSPLPAPEGDVTLGIAQAVVPARENMVVEVRIEGDEVEHAARLGVSAVLTVVFGEGEEGEKVVKVPVSFAREGAATKRFALAGREVREKP
jgi:Ca-activated chloride channel family protein